MSPNKITSDHLVDYAMGFLPLEEARQVEAALAQDESLKAEYQEIQDSLAEYSKAFEKEPPAHLKDEIFSMIADELESKPESLPEIKPPSSAWKWVGIAAGLALLVSVGFNYKLNSDLEKAENELAFLRSEKEELITSYASLEDQAKDQAEELDVLRNVNNKTITLEGTDFMPNAMAMVYWNPETKAVYLHQGKLPEPPSGMQHQLWAIVDGQPVDMGVFDLNESDPVKHMGAIATAQAFAITLEKEGGSPSPNLENLCVIANV